MIVDIELSKIEKKEIPISYFEIPKHIEDKEKKKINKDSKRFKFLQNSELVFLFSFFYPPKMTNQELSSTSHILKCLW